MRSLQWRTKDSRSSDYFEEKGWIPEFKNDKMQNKAARIEEETMMQDALVKNKSTRVENSRKLNRN